MSSDHSNASSNNSWTPLFDRFNQAIRTEADTFFKHIADSQTNLINERDSLCKEIELLRKEKDEMTQLLKKYDQIVTLNIGGQLFSTTIGTLTKEKCLFTKMFSGLFDLRDHQGATFIDRDPTHFRILLNYLRTNTFIVPKSTQECAELLLEAEYYQIATLIEQLKCDTSKDITVLVEKLLFDSALHHPQVIISEEGLKAAHSGCYASIGVATSSWNSNKRLGDDSFSWTLRLYNQNTNYDFTGSRHDGKSLPYYNVFSQGTRVGALLDLNEGTLEYVIDGIKRGVAFKNLKGHVVTPVFEFCHQTTYRMNHNASAPAD